MIRELRIRHRRMFIIIAIVLPLLVVIGLAVRRNIPPMEKLPDPVDKLVGETK